MCIRDRVTVIKFIQGKTEAYRIDYPTPVSYTHLDVYKRQALYIGEIAFEDMTHNIRRTCRSLVCGYTAGIAWVQN